MGIVQANEKTNIDKFLALHYPVSDHNGALHLWAKRQNSNRMYRVCYGEAGKILEKIEQDHIGRRKKDYYLTANTVSAGARRSDALYSLNNIVVDIDNHNRDQGDLDRQYRALQDIYTSFDLYGYYIPNTIVKTGRGFQLWFSIEQMSYKLRDVWEDLTDEILRQTESILSEYPIFNGLTLDTGASRNISGLYRLPISFNSKSRTRAVLEILHDVPIDALAEVREIRKKKEKQAVVYRPRVESSVYKQAEYRESSIVRLIKLRQDRGQTIERDNFLFCVFCVWSNVFKDEAEILERVLRVNNLFNHPFTEREVNSALYTAFRKRYRLRNATMISKLNVTAEEQEEVGLLCGGREYKRIQARKGKSERDNKILSLYKDGQTQEEIAKTLQISRKTVCNVLMRLNARKSDLKKQAYKDIRDRYKQALKAKIKAYKQNMTPSSADGLFSMQKCVKNALNSVVVLADKSAPSSRFGGASLPGGGFSLSGGSLSDSPGGLSPGVI